MFTGGLTQHCLTQLAPTVPTAEDICVTTGFDRMRRSQLLQCSDRSALSNCDQMLVSASHRGYQRVRTLTELPSTSVHKLTGVSLDVKCTWLLLLLFMLSWCDLTLNWSRTEFLVELQNVERHENSLNSFRVTTSRQADRQTWHGEARRRIWETFRYKCANNGHVTWWTHAAW